MDYLFAFFVFCLQQFSFLVLFVWVSSDNKKHCWLNANLSFEEKRHLIISKSIFSQLINIIYFFPVVLKTANKYCEKEVTNTIFDYGSTWTVLSYGLKLSDYSNKLHSKIWKNPNVQNYFFYMFKITLYFGRLNIISFDNLICLQISALKMSK